MGFAIDFDHLLRQLIAITSCMEVYIPPIRPRETYSQGFWHAVFAGGLYFLGASMLMINMLGYFLGHYPQHFDLDDDQRTLILQTIMYFTWLAGGAAVFASLEGWSYANSLYWSDVSILTIGFGDMAPGTTGARVFLFFWEPIGIVFLGLVIGSITRFVANISADKIIKRHQTQVWKATLGKTVTSERELRERLGLPGRKTSDIGRTRRESISEYGKLEIHGKNVVFNRSNMILPPLSTSAFIQHGSTPSRRNLRKEKLLLLREEEDRFDLMRQIESRTRRFKRYWSLSMAILAFLVLWTIGATIFMCVERRLQKYTFFDSLYFSFVALFTIGYGDMNPSSNVGKPFFIIWSTVAVPTMTVLIQEMGNTIVAAVNKGTFKIADWTVLPKKGVFHTFLDNHPVFQGWATKLSRRSRESKELKIQNALVQDGQPDGDTVARDKDAVLRLFADRETKTASESQHELARELAKAIKQVSRDVEANGTKKYSYVQWVHFTKLIRFSNYGEHSIGLEEEEEERGLIEWDWLGENSPMLDDCSEPVWVLERLCESLTRYTTRLAKVCSTCVF